jgi:multimeric flavodoxin WrbA
MKVIAISGSRSPEGQTAQALNAACDGLKAEGVDCIIHFLPTLKIERCRQCDESGWGLCRKEGSCIIEDDFSNCIDELRRSDGAVIATPVYFSDLSESMRAFLDRLRRIARHENGRSGIEGTPAIGVCVAGGGGGGAISCALNLEKIAGTCGFDIKDIIPVRRQNLQHKISVLKETGRWFAAELSQLA